MLILATTTLHWRPFPFALPAILQALNVVVYLSGLFPAIDDMLTGIDDTHFTRLPLDFTMLAQFDQPMRNVYSCLQVVFSCCPLRIARTRLMFTASREIILGEHVSKVQRREKASDGRECTVRHQGISWQAHCELGNLSVNHSSRCRLCTSKKL